MFLASLVFTIILLIGATTGFAKDEFQADVKEPNFRFYTIEWIDVADDNGRKYVCGTKVTTFDHSGRKYVMEYYYLLTNENKVVTRFELDALQVSFETIEPLKTESLAIKLHGSIINKDGEDILAGIRGSDEDYKGIACRIINDHSLWLESNFMYTEVFNQKKQCQHKKDKME